MTLWNTFFIAMAAINIGLIPFAIEDRNWRWLGLCVIGLLGALAAMT